MKWLLTRFTFAVVLFAACVTCRFESSSNSATTGRSSPSRAAARITAPSSSTSSQHVMLSQSTPAVSATISGSSPSPAPSPRRSTALVLVNDSGAPIYSTRISEDPTRSADYARGDAVFCGYDVFAGPFWIVYPASSIPSGVIPQAQRCYTIGVGPYTPPPAPQPTPSPTPAPQPAVVGPTNYIIGLNFPRIFGDAETVTLEEQDGNGPITTSTVVVRDLTHHMHAPPPDCAPTNGCTPFEPFAALEIQRTLSASQMALGVRARLVSTTDPNRFVGYRGLAIYQWGHN